MYKVGHQVGHRYRERLAGSGEVTHQRGGIDQLHQRQ